MTSILVTFVAVTRHFMSKIKYPKRERVHLRYDSREREKKKNNGEVNAAGSQSKKVRSSYHQLHTENREQTKSKSRV